jgi:hypothetical protein
MDVSVLLVQGLESSRYEYCSPPIGGLGVFGIDVGVVLYMCVDRVPAAYIRFTLSRLKNIRFIVFVFNYDMGCSDFSLLVFCVDSVVGQGQTTQVYLWLY